MPSGRVEQHYRCPIIGYAVNDPNPRRCTRHFRKGLIKIKHVCKFDLPQSQEKGFPENYNCKDIPENDEMYLIISEALAILSSKLDISAHKACSNEMSSFISKMISIGKRLRPKNSLFDKANPFTISTFHFLEVTERVSGEIESKMIRKLQKI